MSSSSHKEYEVSERIGRRRFLGRGLRVSAGAGLTKVLGSSGTSKVVDWARLIERIIREENARWLNVLKSRGHNFDWIGSPGYLSYIKEFTAAIQKHMTLEMFVKMRGISYISMEYDMYLDDMAEWLRLLPHMLVDYVKYMKYLP